HAFVALAVFALSQSAYGTDLSVRALDAPASFDWTGYYTGAHLDYQAGQSRWSESRFGALGAAGVFNVGKGYDFSSGTGSYAIRFHAATTIWMLRIMCSALAASAARPRRSIDTGTFIT